MIHIGHIMASYHRKRSQAVPSRGGEDVHDWAARALGVGTGVPGGQRSMGQPTRYCSWLDSVCLSKWVRLAPRHESWTGPS